MLSLYIVVLISGRGLESLTGVVGKTVVHSYCVGLVRLSMLSTGVNNLCY